jgi:hypothetical protein
MLDRREGEDVGGALFFAVGAIQAGDFCVGDEGDDDFGLAEAQVAADAAEERLQRRPRDAHCPLAVQNHPL